VQAGLHLAGAVHRIDRAMEAAQGAVADLTHHPAVKFRKKQTQQLAMIFQCAKGLLLVAPHDRGVAHHVAEHDRGKLAGRITGRRI
jgi:hypothetical protein